MTKRQQKVLSMLKPKVKAFGFNQKELKGVAARIADNLTSEEDASDEDVNAEIENAIEAVLPYLEFGRSFANRVINDSRNETRTNVEEEEEEEDASEPSAKSTPKQKVKNPEKETDAMKLLLDEIKGLRNEISAIKGEKVTDTRRGKLETLLKDTGAFGTRTLKSFSKMKFDSDDEFDEFFTEVEEDLKSFNQERANAGLARLGTTQAGSHQQKKDTEPNVLSDDDVKAIAGVKS